MPTITPERDMLLGGIADVGHLHRPSRYPLPGEITPAELPREDERYRDALATEPTSEGGGGGSVSAGVSAESSTFSQQVRAWLQQLDEMFATSLGELLRTHADFDSAEYDEDIDLPSMRRAVGTRRLRIVSRTKRMPTLGVAAEDLEVYLEASRDD